MNANDSTASADFATGFRRSFGRNPRTSSQTTKVTREELARLEDAARREGLSLGEWSREVLLRAADGITPDPTFTEVVAMRSLLIVTLRNLACGKTMTPEAFAAELTTIRQNKHVLAAQLMQQYQEKGGEQ